MPDSTTELTERSRLIGALSTTLPGPGAGPEARRQAVGNLLDRYRVVVPEPDAQVWTAPTVGDDELSAASAMLVMLVRLPKAAQIRLLDYLQDRASHDLASSDRAPLVVPRDDDPTA